jgi:hypothetical protein
MGLIAYMLEDEFATADELFAAGATFTLLAWAFAYVYVVCQALLPGSFAALCDAGKPRTWMELLFLSFTTLSGVALGDILPLLPMARALVMIEEFSGVMYLALVVSRLIFDVGKDANGALNQCCKRSCSSAQGRDSWTHSSPHPVCSRSSR